MTDKGAPTPAPATASFADFDAFFAEAEGKPVVIPFAGRDWECPGSIPAGTLLHIDRLMVQIARMERTGTVPDDFEIDDDLSVETIARKLAGDENVDGWLAAGMTFRRLQTYCHILQRVHRGTSIEVALGEVLGEVKAAPPEPARAEPQDRKPKTASPSKRSSSGGARSKRTGSGSTAKT